MPDRDGFPTVFARLTALLAVHAPPLAVVTEAVADYGVVAKPTAKYPDGLPFGVVQIKKNYVSYHLFPVYLFPELLDGVGEPLRKRMQGKSCFNLTKPDETVVAELGRLTEAGFARYERERLV